MLISAWLTAVRNRLQSPSATKRRTKRKQAASAAEGLEFRTLLTTTLQAVRPNVGEFFVQNEVRNIAPQELTLQFSLGSTITPASIDRELDSIRVFRPGADGIFGLGGILGYGDDVPVTIGYVGPGSVPNEVVLRFGENLVDDHYRIVVNGTGTEPLLATVLTAGGPVADPVLDSTFAFELDLGARVVAVDPQPVTRAVDGTLSQARDQIVVYFNNDDLDPVTAEDPAYYQLIFTNETISSLDDLVHLPIDVDYDSVMDKATLTFASDVASLSGAGSYRLRIGTTETLPQAPAAITPGVDPGSSFAGANTDIGTVSSTGNSSRVISSAISAQNFAFQFPGAGDEPGHREIEVENHLHGGADSDASGIPVFDFNFKDIYGSDPQGNTLFNLITEAQKERAREIFNYYGHYAGMDFRETAASGLTIVTGDMRALDPTIPTGPGGVAGLAGGVTAIMDMAETWSDEAGGNWFSVAMHEIGHLLGQGHTYDLPDITVQGSGTDGSTGVNVEPDYPGDHDIVHMQHMFRPDSIDIDMYRFELTATSGFSAEIMAERQSNSSNLDSVLRLYRETNGVRELISQNDDYFSNDSYLDLVLEPGIYFIGVSSTGNDAYDPTIANTGIGGTSQGVYDLRVNFRPEAVQSILDTTGRAFDGNSDGVAGGVYNFWFRTATVANTLFVDKTHVSYLSNAVTVAATQIVVQRVAPYAVNDVIRVNNEQMRVTAINPATRTLTVTRAINATTAATHSVGVPVKKVASNGAIGTPFGLINDAITASVSGQIIRIVGNGGADNDITTIGDNLPYEIGVNTSNQPLVDGSTLEVPRGVTMMIDAGAILKLRRAAIGVGSSTAGVDRSGNGLQVLGIPGRTVIFTSWNDEAVGTDTTVTPTTPIAGDWGGIAFRNEVDRAQNRYTPANEGIFLNYVGYGDFRYGGGNVTIDSVLQPVAPVNMDRAQPTVVHNIITNSAESALSADPDSFEELTFHSPRFQAGKPAFTSDYKRVGPDIYGNTLRTNGNNGLFVRIDTTAGNLPQKLTVPGRFDDTDIVHIVAQNLEISGTPGGAYFDTVPPSVTLVTLTAQAGGTLAVGTYNYRIVFVDENGFESPASVATGNLTTTSTGSIRLAQLPPASGAYIGRRIYRRDPAAPTTYRLVGELDTTATTFTDTGVTLARSFTNATAPGSRNRARYNGRLSIDPGIIVKLQGSRIETEVGGQLIAEGRSGRPVIFTSRLDDRYGAGGTFDTNNDDNATAETAPGPGNWGGLYIGHTSSASIDRALITFGGGLTALGSGFQGFNALEVHQAEARVRNTVFESNANGASSGNRTGLFPNAPGTIFVRAAQPVILDNSFINNAGAVININTNALNKDFVADTGRSTGLADVQLSYGDNQGPLIRDNTFDGNTLNGMIVRGESVTTQVIWDDTDIVHIVQSEIYIPNLHTYGGVRLESSPTESLVIKLSGANAGFTAGGSTLDITDRIGGMLHVIGQAGQPVIMTSLSDDTVGAGFNLQGLLQRDTNNNGNATSPAAGSWRGVRVETYSHDRNIAVYVENEIADRLSAESNATTAQAENIGSLASDQKYGDENLRIGIDLQGFIDNTSDVDVYSFSGVAGTQVWIDIDRSTHALDTVVELLTSDGAIVAQSDNYLDEKLGGTWSVFTQSGSGTQAFGLDYSQYLSDDHFTTNQRDAGMRVVLPGTVGLRGTYFVRVRSSNIDPTTAAPRTDLQDNLKVANGLTSGVYQLQLRLQEEDEFAGTTVQYADIRYATTGIEIIGQPTHSPLLGENEEVENNDSILTANAVGNLMNTDRAALAIRGTLSANPTSDIDFYRFEVNYINTQQIAGVSLQGPHVPVIFDLDYADGMGRANTTLGVFDSNFRLILIGRDSNIADDQPGPLEGSDTDDLSRGSVGKFDPYIGTVELPGGTYYLGVTNGRVMPTVLDQYTLAASTSPLLRMEPVNSVNRIAEERFGAADIFTAANAPITDLFDAAGGLDPKHIVPWHLGDINLFVSLPGGLKGSDESTIVTINPFTGQPVAALGSFGQSSADIAMRADGQLYTFSTGPNGAGESTPGVTGNYLRIDTGTAATTFVGDDGITTNRLTTPLAVPPAVVDANAGVIFEAIAFTGTGDKNLFAIGNRANVTPPADSGLFAQYTTNVMYRFDIRTGAVDGNGADRVDAARANNGAGTTQREIGEVQAFGTVTGMASIGGVMFAVDNLGFLYQVSTANAATTNIANVGFNFSGLTAGPDEVENGAFADILFATTALGEIVAFDTAGNLVPVFVDGQSSINTGVPGLNGLAFSTLDRNLWATTTNRGTDLGHGVETRFDGSVLANRQNGGSSLYFGNQRAGAAQGNQNDLATGVQRTVNFPGGARGSVVSNSFDLSNYDKADKPVLYFNYFLATEGANYVPPGAVADLMRDSFRVFVGDESGTWNLVTTNNSFRDSNGFDEFDYGPDGTFTAAPVTQTHPDVVETFDNTGGWRQARIDLSNYAGRSDLRLRFDFTTAGSMNLGDTFTTGSELRTIDGSKMRDGDTVTIDGIVFEFDMGSTLVMPTGAAAVGQSFTVGGQTFTYSLAAGGATTIVLTTADTAATVATKTLARVNAVLGGGSAVLPTVAGSNRVTFPGRTVTAFTAALTLDGAAGIAGTSDRAVVITPNMTANDIAIVLRQAIADQFSGGDITNIKGSEDLIWIIGHDVDNNGPLGFADVLPGDQFGAFAAGFQNGVALRPGYMAGMNNNVEGVYVDDIILGFAERGEMVINAPVNGGYSLDPDTTNTNYPAGNTYLGINVGAYDVEIRRATDYAQTEDAPPINTLYRGIDTNDREANLSSIVIPAGASLVDGATFAINDGINTVTFQFIDSKGTTVPTPGFFPISFNPAFGAADDHDGETATSIAAKIRDAINSITVQSVLDVKASMSDGTFSGAGSNDIRLHLTGNAIVTVSASIAGVLQIQNFNAYGDRNHFRDQGQLIVRSSTVSDSLNYGISSDASARSQILSSVGPAHPGSVRNLQEINNARLATSVVIMNNVITANGQGGINLSGDTVTGPLGVVPYARIVNNTLVGLNGGGIGINIVEGSAPTLLNNIIADFGTGIVIDGASQATTATFGANLFRGNGANANPGGFTGAFPIFLTNSEPLFVDQANRNYYLAPLSKAIDSSVSSVGDRESMKTVKNPLDLDGLDDAGSPILAPDLDVYGQLRGNDPDVETPAGQGVSVFIDRGAIDRVDFFQPRAQLVNPEDQSLIDGDADVDEVWIDQSQTLRQFRIRLVDEGIGIDGQSVTSSQFVLKRVDVDGVTEITLVDGVDYTFVYNVITKEAILNAATFFADANTELRYIILVDNDGLSATDTVDGVRDLAGNYLFANKADGTTRFDIVLTDGVNDPPENRVPGSQTTPEDVSLVFNATNGNVISIFDQDAHLGTNVLTVTLTATDGTLTLGTIPATLTFSVGDGTDDATMEFTGKLQDLNAALLGLIFTPDQDYFGPASVTILTNDLGEFSGPPALTSTTIAIDVTPVNDPPVFILAGDPAAVLEDSLLVSVPAFMTGQAPGPANESAETFTVQTTVTFATGLWNITNFFVVAPSIDSVTGNLTYRAATDVNGTATISIVLTDNGVPAASSLAQTFVITVNAINDAPVFTSTTTDSRVNGSGNITTLEDAGLQTINYVATSAAGRSTALDEVSTQTLTWTRSAPITTQGTLAFTSLTVNPSTGVITYNTVADTHGTATIVLTATDNGSSVLPNVNVATRTITINVTPVNDAPVARTGNYTVDEQYGIELNASTSTDVDTYFVSPTDNFTDVLRYAWDLDNNGTYETSSNTSPTLTLTWADLANLGITAPNVTTIGLRVTDSSGASNNIGVATATLTTLIVDYGDAPNSYGTLQTSNGAAHTIANGLFLGSTVTKETTGQPSTAANLDTGDDGVTFPTSIETTVGQVLPSYVDVVASKAGKLDVWLDLNGNGVFDDPTEHLNSGASYNVVAGSNRINFIVPAGATIGSSFMRFRLSTAGTALPTGRANDGEVEDYAVEIKPLRDAFPPTFILPIDFNGSAIPVAQTSDLTPTISWTLDERNYVYNLVLKNSVGTTVFTVNGTSFTSATVPANLPQGRYVATLTAFNKANQPASPVVWTFDVVPLVVSSPTPEVTTSRPVINWTNVIGTKSYRVVVESLTNGSTVINQTIITASVVSPAIPNQFTPTADLPLGQYRVRVQATDAADLLGDWSAYRLFTVRTAPVLTAPALSTNDLRPVVAWSPVAGAVSYRVTLSFVTDTGVAPVTVIVSGTSWTPTADLRLGEYQVKVQAFSAANATGQSSVESVLRTFAVKTPPVSTQPIGRVSDTTPTFSWTAVPGADRYELVVSKAWGNNAEVIRLSTLTGTSFTQPTTLELGPYTYSMRAINNASASGAASVVSNSSTVYSFSIVEPPVITGPALTTFSNHPTVTWVAPPNSETFDIYYRLVGDSNPEFLRVNGVTGSSYTPNEKLFGIGTYIVWVRTYSNTDNPATPRLPNGTGDERVVSNWSLQRTFRVSTPPTLLGPTGRTSVANPTLTWQSVPGALNYEIWIDNNSVPVSRIYNQSGITALNYTVPANLPIGQYTFWVRAKNQFGTDSNWSLPKIFSVTSWPTLTGPSSSTFDTTPTFNWTNMRSTLGSVTAGAARYEFRIYGVDPTTKLYVELPQYTVTTLTSNTYTIPADKALPAGNYRAYVRGIANGRPTAGVPETVSAFSYFIPFYVGGIPEVPTLPITTNTTPTLLWQAVDGASGYQVFLSTAALPNTDLLNSLNNRTGGTSFVVPQALSKGVYRYWIRAFNASTGAAGTWSERKTLTIVDAGDAGLDELQNEPTEFVWTVVPGLIPQTMVTESAVSMVPAIVDGSQYLPLPEEATSDAVSEVSPNDGEVMVINAEDSVAAEQTDSVLSQWDEQLWWESQPKARKPAESDQKISAAGFLGALFAMAPRSIRRRKNDE